MSESKVDSFLDRFGYKGQKRKKVKKVLVTYLGLSEERKRIAKNYFETLLKVKQQTPEQKQALEQ